MPAPLVITAAPRDRRSEVPMEEAGRYARAEEQAWPLAMLGSPRMSYVAGEVLAVDGGIQGARDTGRQRAAWADMITDTERAAR